MIDFNEIELDTFQVIPSLAMLKVSLEIKRGGYNEMDLGWTDNLVTKSDKGSCYLNCILTVLGGEYTGRKIFTMIGLHSETSELFARIGMQTLRSIVESQNGLLPTDTSEQATKLRCIELYSDIEGKPFVITVGIRNDQNGNPKNNLAKIINPSNPKYTEIMEQGTSEWIPF